ncbi:MAG: hypothetical protein RL676_608 [Pseudomonadota bacterium]
MLMTSPCIPLAFVDLETTGATATKDRITEIGIVLVHQEGVTRYSQLVNPGCVIPEFIQGLTGITNDMVADAPSFSDIAQDVFDRLEGCLFVAHNARFDYGFIKNEFKRLGVDFRARVLCTVKLSRELYPEQARHNLDALIARHGLIASGRHRALADADLIFQFWQRLIQAWPYDRIEQAVRKLTARPALPSQLDPDLPDQLPEGHGVYIFYGANNFPLYVGKSTNIRKRVMSHFSSDHASGKELSLSMQVCRVDWIETAGEVSSLLRESALVKSLQPSHNTRLRRTKELCAWRIPSAIPGAGTSEAAAQITPPELVWARDLDFGAQPDLYGLFRSQRDAITMLSELAQQEKLCRSVLGLEKVKPGAACFGVQLKQCRGACTGNEKLELHHARLMMAMARHRLPQWPHPGPVGLREGDVMHVVDRWCYLGSATQEHDLDELLVSGRPVFDLDVYKILRRAMRVLSVVTLQRR